MSDITFHDDEQPGERPASAMVLLGLVFVVFQGLTFYLLYGDPDLSVRKGMPQPQALPGLLANITENIGFCSLLTLIRLWIRAGRAQSRLKRVAMKVLAICTIGLAVLTLMGIGLVIWCYWRGY